MVERVAERGIQLTLTDEAEQLLGNMGYDTCLRRPPSAPRDPEASAEAAAGRLGQRHARV